MANTERVLLPAHYVGVDTSAGPASYAPAEVDYKVYEIANIGSAGNAATVTLTGVDDIILADGEAVKLIYSPDLGWVDFGLLPNLTITNDLVAGGLITAGDGFSLASGIKVTDRIIGSVVSGYNVIAKVDAIAGNNASARFKIIDSGGGYEVEAAITMSASAKTHANTTIKILDFWGTPVITSFILAKSDSVNASGAWLIANATGSSDVTIIVAENTGNSAGWELVTPYSDPDPVTLPDGVTIATFLIAGNTYNVVSSSFAPIGTPALKISSTEVSWAIPWGVTPLPYATTITKSGTLSASGGGVSAGVTSLAIDSIDYKQKIVNVVGTIDNPATLSLTALVVTSTGNAVLTLG